MPTAQLSASRDPVTGQVYVPPRQLVADGSLRPTESVQVPAQGVLYSATRFNEESYGIVDLDCGARIQTRLEPGTDRIGERVRAAVPNGQEPLRFSHD